MVCIKGFYSLKSLLPLSEFLESYCHMKLSQHAMLVVARHYANPGPLKITWEFILNLTREKVPAIVIVWF